MTDSILRSSRETVTNKDSPYHISAEKAKAEVAALSPFKEGQPIGDPAGEDFILPLAMLTSRSHSLLSLFFYPFSGRNILRARLSKPPVG